MLQDLQSAMLRPNRMKVLGLDLLQQIWFVCLSLVEYLSPLFDDEREPLPADAFEPVAYAPD